MLVGLLLISFSACSKKDALGGTSGNDTGNGTGNTAGVDPPSNSVDGVVFINNGTSAIFNLYAPGKKSVQLIGDFNSWSTTDSKYTMKNSKDGTRWWVQIDNLDASTEYAYQYYIDGSLKVADPYARKILDPDNDKYIPATVYPNLKAYPTGKTTGIVGVTQGNPTPYTWKVSNFVKPDQKNLVVYELLVRDFLNPSITNPHSYKALTDSLDYLVKLGINAVELMPVNEFEGNDSWGYNSNFMFALDKYYGTSNDYKAFIDACHSHGIAVIQDIVLEDQFGSSPLVQMYADASGAPSASNPWMDQANMHPDAVGYQMNHQSKATQKFSEDVMKYWVQEYHIDGYRFDEAKGFTQTNSGLTDEAAWAAYDASRVATWKMYNTYMKSVDPTMYVILEYFAVDKEETELTGQGMMVWNNLNGYALQAAMGYNDTGGSWDLSRLFYDQHSSTVPYGLMGYWESHDQERLQFKNGMYGNSNSALNYNIKDLATGLKRDEMMAAFLFSSPGPKMVWQFGERGYDISIDDGGRLGDKAPHWEYLNDVNRVHLMNVYSKLIKWKINNAVFTTTTFNYDLANDPLKWVALKGTDNNVVIVGNFDVAARTATVSFPTTGTYHDNFGGADLNVSNASYTITLAPGEYHVYSSTLLK